MKAAGNRRIRAALTGLIAVVVLAAAVAGWRTRHDDDRNSLTAIFANASPLVAGNEVRLDGVKVGTIRSITLENGRARVAIRLNDESPALHQDARAVIRPVSLLGERYVDLDAGTDSAPYLTSRVIPVEHTSAAVDLDQVLNSLDDPTSAALAALVTTLGEGVNGRGDDVAAALKALEPAMTQTGQLATVLDQQNRVLNQLVESASGNARALADRNGASMDRLVATAQQTLATVAANREALDGALRELPATLAKARRTLANLAGVADEATPALRDIRPVTDDLTSISAELESFSAAADPALGSLPQLLAKLDRMLQEARPVVQQLAPASGDLRTASGALRPIGARLLDHKPGTPSHLENLLTGAANWGMATSGYDGLSHYFRGVVGLTPDTIRNLAAGALPALGPLDQGNVPDDPNAPDEKTQQAPSKSLLPGLTSLTGQRGQTGQTGQSDPSNATGLDPQQERSLLDQLLGGI